MLIVYSSLGAVLAVNLAHAVHPPPDLTALFPQEHDNHSEKPYCYMALSRLPCQDFSHDGHLYLSGGRSYLAPVPEQLHAPASTCALLSKIGGPYRALMVHNKGCTDSGIQVVHRINEDFPTTDQTPGAHAFCV